MKFLSGALAVLIAATQASAATVSFSAFNVDGFDTGSYDKALYYANGSMYVGGIQAKPYAEKLIFTVSDQFYNYTYTSSKITQISGNTTLSFTSSSSSPTGWQNLLIFPTQSKPIAFTVPHSGAIPDGAVMGPFANTVYPAGMKLLNYPDNAANGTRYGYFVLKKVDSALEEQTYQVYWQGGEDIDGGIVVAMRM